MSNKFKNPKRFGARPSPREARLVKAITRLVVGFSGAELELSQAIPSHSDQIADKLPPSLPGL